MTNHQRIGLIGGTGVGKSTVARYLAESHRFQVCNTGSTCREISRILFGNEDKNNLNMLTDLLQQIDKAIFLKAAIRLQDWQRPCVIDALRYHHDWEFAKSAGFKIIRITAPDDLRRMWLEKRGQVFDFTTDGVHQSEIELADASVDYMIENVGTIGNLFKKINQIVMR